MASRGSLPSDPEYLLSYLDGLPEESDTDEEFEGYLEQDEGPSHQRRDGGSPQRRRSHSLESLSDAALPAESALTDRSPSPTPMQGQHASGSPLSPTHSSLPSGNSPQPPVFSGSPGVLVPDMEDKAPVDFFRLFFDNRVMDLILQETTRYADQYLEKEREHLETHPHARAHEWRRQPLTMKDVEVFLAILIGMEICGFPTLRSYWSKGLPFSNNNFSSVMSSRRFELILKFLHLNDSDKQPRRDQPGYDKLYKIRPLLDLLLESFNDAYTPSQHLSIDESMISYKGRLSFLQYLPSKPHKWGMKAWVLADSSNGYTWGWRLYTGKEGDRGERGLAHQVVLQLLDNPRLEGKGYIVFMDNFYSSPSLFTDLISKGFGACGTVRRNRRGLPAVVCDTRLKRGEVVSSRDGGVLALKWHDKRDVMMLSTYHSDEMVTKRRRSRTAVGGVEDILKPKVVEEYNQHMGGVDQSDQLLQYYGFPHRSRKWWKRVFFHLLDLSMVNSHIIFQQATGTKLTLLEFRTAVATSLLEGLEHPRKRHAACAPELPLRLTERAFPEPIPNSGRADCTVCSDRKARRRHQTGFRCKLCHTPLCLYPCFERYHTLKNYKITS